MLNFYLKSSIAIADLAKIVIAMEGGGGGGGNSSYLVKESEKKI